MKTHLLYPQENNPHGVTFCGRKSQPQATTDPSLSDCRSCFRAYIGRKKYMSSTIHLLPNLADFENKTVCGLSTVTRETKAVSIFSNVVDCIFCRDLAEPRPIFKIRKSKYTGWWNLYCRQCQYSSPYPQWWQALYSIKTHIKYFHKERS